jgi:DNA-binding CsgD family transcriptional regulator
MKVGKSSSEIACELGFAVSTVNTIVKEKAMMKLRTITKKGKGQ